MDRIAKISAVVLTKNEEAGLDNTLKRLEMFDEVIVVDSYSDDKTTSIAIANGARVIQFAWDGQYPKKKQWALENCQSMNRWILLLDADEYPSPELIEELSKNQSAIAAGNVSAYDIDLAYRFAGKYLRHGHVVTKRSLIHVDRAAFPVVDDLDAPGIREVEGHYQPETKSPVAKLAGRLVHDDRDPISSWFARHNRYSDWEAHLRQDSKLRRQVAGKRTTKGQIFDRVPFKPALFFVYSYIARFGFLDGRAGFDYALALSMYYWQIALKCRELEQAWNE